MKKIIETLKFIGAIILAAAAVAFYVLTFGKKGRSLKREKLADESEGKIGEVIQDQERLDEINKKLEERRKKDEEIRKKQEELQNKRRTKKEVSNTNEEKSMSDLVGDLKSSVSNRGKRVRTTKPKT